MTNNKPSLSRMAIETVISVSIIVFMWLGVTHRAEGAGAQRERAMILREEVCRRPGFVVATGTVVRTSDGSDVFYVGGVTLMAPPNSGPLTQLGSLERSGKTYQLIAVPVER